MYQLHYINCRNVYPQIVFEFLSKNIKSALQDGMLSPVQTRSIMQQVADALSYLHLSRLEHRDVKPVNIMLTLQLTAKLIDFGLAKEKKSSQIYLGGANQGTVLYMAPELFSPEGGDKAVDVYAYGITLYEVVFNVEPYAGMAADDIPAFVKQGKRPWHAAKAPQLNACDATMKGLIEACVNAVPSKRPPAGTIVSMLQSTEKVSILIAPIYIYICMYICIYV